MWQLITDNLPMLMEGSGETLVMTFVSALFAYLIGVPLGVALILTDKDGLRPMRAFNAVLGWIVNVGRSIPFVILMLVIAPLTRLIVGKAFGTKATIVPLVVAAAPFVARMVEQSLKEIDSGVVEAARTMGATNMEIILKVLLPESVPSLIRGAAVTVITLVGYSAMAGALGGGGLGDIAVRYGMHRYQYDVMILTLILIVIIVQVIQVIFELVAKKIDKRTREYNFTLYFSIKSIFRRKNHEAYQENPCRAAGPCAGCGAVCLLFCAEARRVSRRDCGRIPRCHRCSSARREPGR